jgi:hypothetical protein
MRPAAQALEMSDVAAQIHYDFLLLSSYPSRSSDQRLTDQVARRVGRPASRAVAMADPRSATWSFTKMFETLLRIVFSLSWSCSAMSVFVLPPAMRSRMSRSRDVKDGNG